MKELKIWEKAIIGTKAAFLQIADEKTFARECNFALQAFKGNTYLQDCPLPTIQDAVMNIALTGATLNPALQQANLIPRKVKGKMTCCLDFTYRGLIRLATKEGSVVDMDADVVYEGDEFYYERGLTPILKHIPSLNRKAKAEVQFVYATALLLNNIKKFIVLNRADIEKVRKSSMAPDSPMWKDWFEEGARKTAIKKLYKMLPQTEQMSQAVDVIDKHEGVDFVAREKEIKQENASTLEDTFGSDVPQVQPDENPKLSENALTKIQTLFTNCKIKNRNDKLNVMSEITKRKIETTKDLTSSEADMVIKELEKMAGMVQTSETPKTNELSAEQLGELVNKIKSVKRIEVLKAIRNSTFQNGIKLSEKDSKMLIKLIHEKEKELTGKDTFREFDPLCLERCKKYPHVSECPVAHIDGARGQCAEYRKLKGEE